MEKNFESWAIIELFGHQRIAGRVSNQEIGGASFVRVDVPDTPNQKGFTKLFGASAIYAITPTDEETATAAACQFEPKPMDKWMIREILEQKMLPEGEGDDYQEEF